VRDRTLLVFLLADRGFRGCSIIKLALVEACQELEDQRGLAFLLNNDGVLVVDWHPLVFTINALSVEGKWAEGEDVVLEVGLGLANLLCFAFQGEVVLVQGESARFNGHRKFDSDFRFFK